MAGNQAAFLDGAGQKLRVASADIPHPSSREIVIRNRAAAVNPIDCKVAVLYRNATRLILFYREGSGPRSHGPGMADSTWHGCSWRSIRGGKRCWGRIQKGR